MLMKDEDIAKIHPGSIVRGEDGRRFKVTRIRKETPMRSVSDEIEQLEKTVDALQNDLEARLGKFDNVNDPVSEDDDETAVAKLSDEVSELAKNVEDALAVADTSFAKHVNDIAKRDEIGPVLAMQKARKEYPASYETYQRGGIVKSTMGVNRALGFEPLGPAGAREAKQKFDEAVSRIVARDKISRFAALSKARTENADLFKAMQGE
jgi:hypothetical protein